MLSINRHGILSPNPGGDHEIQPGDVLLCYGKMLGLRALIPPDPREAAPARTRRVTKQPHHRAR